jgi:imidazolonepropionase-like amidohydrolase
MRRFAIALAIAALIAPILDAQQPKKRLALVGGMLLDGYQTPPVHHAAILIEDDKIVDVGPASEVTIPAGTTVIDTSGRTMMPGLIDVHVHLMILGHGNYGVWFPWLAKNGSERVMEISAKQLLMAGVTSAVDLVGPLKESLSVRDRINKGEIPGPRMWMSGPWLTKTLSNYPPELKFQLQINGPDDAARQTEELAKAGVDVIKAYPMSFDEYKAVADTAHRYKLKVHAHVYDSDNVRDALKAGIDVLTHVGAASRQTYDPALVREIVEKSRPVVPTAALWFDVGPATQEFPERLQDPRLKADFPPDIYKEVQDSFKSPHTLGYFRNMNRVMMFGAPLVKQWIDSGAVIGMGTDSGTPMNFHTEALWRELKVFVEQGMSPLRAIEAATRINAQILGRGNDLGTIERGKLADVIVVKGNPLANIYALDDPLVVVKGGVVYKGGRAPAQSTSSR